MVFVCLLNSSNTCRHGKHCLWGVATLRKLRKEVDATWTLNHGGRGKGEGEILLFATFTYRSLKIVQKLYVYIHTYIVAIEMRDELY